MNAAPSLHPVTAGVVLSRVEMPARPTSANPIANLVIEALDEFAVGSYLGCQGTMSDYAIGAPTVTARN